MATVQRQTNQRGAPPPTRRAVPPSPTVTDILPPQKNGAIGPFIAPFCICMYGLSGVGKTSMWGHAEDVGFLHDPQEEGVEVLVRFRRIPKPRWIETAENFESTINILADVANHKYKIKLLVLDSLTGFQKLCFQHHAKLHFDSDWSSKEGFMAYQQGPKQVAQTDWPLLLDALDDVKRAGIPVVVIGHSEVKTFKNPNGPDYDRHNVVLDNAVWQVTHRWAEAVLFYDLVVDVEKAKGALRAKAKPETRRIIYTEPVGSCVAKNWWGLEGIINAGESSKEAYDNFIAAYKKAARRAGA